MEYSDFGAIRQAGITASGLRVVVYTIPGRPIAMTAAFDAGRRYDPVGLECLAHVTEHMLVAGTQHLPSKDMIAAYIERLGGNIAARTELSTLLLKLTIGNVADFGAAVYLLNQMLAHSRYDEGVLEKELGSVRQELAALKGNPSRYVDRLFHETLFSNTVLRGKMIDNEPAIDRVRITDVRQYVANWLTGSNMVVVLAGGITLQEAITGLNDLELDCSDLPLISPASVGYHLPQNRIVTKPYTSSSQVQLTYGFASYGADHPDTAALEILTSIIGGGRAGSLSRILRYGAGLVYSVRAHMESEIGCGSWRIGTGTDPAHLNTVIELINAELQRLAKGDVTLEEFDQAKSTLINSAPVTFDPIRSFLEVHVAPDLYGLSDRARIPGRLNAIAATTRQHVVRAARDIFQPRASILTLCGALPDDIDGMVLY